MLTKVVLPVNWRCIPELAALLKSPAATARASGQVGKCKCLSICPKFFGSLMAPHRLQPHTPQRATAPLSLTFHLPCCCEPIVEIPFAGSYHIPQGTIVLSRLHTRTPARTPALPASSILEQNDSPKEDAIFPYLSRKNLKVKGERKAKNLENATRTNRSKARPAPNPATIQ